MGSDELFYVEWSFSLWYSDSLMFTHDDEVPTITVAMWLSHALGSYPYHDNDNECIVMYVDVVNTMTLMGYICIYVCVPDYDSDIE